MPFLLAPGVTGNDLLVDGSPRVLVARDQGFVAIDGEGKATYYPDGSARRIGADAKGAIATIGLDRVARASGVEVPDAVDVAWDCDDGWWVARDDGLGRVAGPWAPIAEPHPGIVGVASGECGRALVWDDDAVWWAGTWGEEPVWSGGAVHAAAYDGAGMVAIVAGEPPVLLTRAAPSASWREVRLPSTPKAIAFGTGGLLPRSNLYLLEDNAVSFLRPSP